ncbi:hypothetical protein BDZ97DRAFT_620079 [Flammula alnicola]|nr:hypothetical protein BDZ97DRAFT_620079 [Flammula alnicola]
MMKAQYKPHKPGTHDVVSRNLPIMCGYCFEPRAPDGPSLRRCADCKHVFYCSREHQKAHWKRHKEYCQDERSDILGKVAVEDEWVPLHQDSLYLGDWMNLHFYMLEHLGADLFRLSKDFDLNKDYAIITLKQREDHAGDPAKFFEIQSMMLSNDPEGVADADVGEKDHKFLLQNIRENVKHIAPDFMEMTKAYSSKNDKLMGTLICVFYIKRMPVYSVSIKPIPIYRSSLEKSFSPDHSKFLKDTINSGTVWCDVDDEGKVCGTMVKKGSNWVFQKASTEFILTEVLGLPLSALGSEPLD